MILFRKRPLGRKNDKMISSVPEGFFDLISWMQMNVFLIQKKKRTKPAKDSTKAIETGRLTINKQ